MSPSLVDRLALPGLASLLALGCLALVRLPEPAPSTADRVRWIQHDRARHALDPAARLPARAVQRGDRGLPPPTEHWLAPDAEKSQKSRRKEWQARMHRAAPEVSWKDIERENGRRMTQWRSAQDGRRPAEVEGSWVERGSEDQAGRMHAAAHSTDGATLVAGSALGGVWRRALDEGDAWEPIGDGLYGGAHWLAVLSGEGEEDVVLAGTDWGYLNRTTDGGQVWSEPALDDDPTAIRRLLVSSDGSETAFVLTGDDGTYRLQRSADGGASFQTVYELGGYAGDLWAPRDGGSTLYLADQGELWVSEDLGESWSLRGALPVSSSAHLAGSEAGAPTLYLVTDNATLHRSDDAGLSWTEVRTLSDYWGALAASIVDADTFAWGGFELWRTFDGGVTADRINEWWEYYDSIEDTLHADMMGFDVVPAGDGAETWYLATDGGLYASRDRLQTVENLSLDGLRVSQYYSTLTQHDDAESIAAGAQDQGYQVSRREVRDGRYSFDQVISGDYGHLTSGDGTHDLVYSVYPGFILVQIGPSGSQLGYVDYPSGEAGRYFAWLPPLAPDPEDPAAFFFCGTRLWRYSYSEASGTWVPEQWSDQAFDQRAYEFLSAFRWAPSDPDKAYAATSWGRLYHSEDGGRTWTQSDDEGPDSHYFYGTAIEIDPRDPDTAFAGGAGYSNDAVYRTTDGGQSWEPWGDGLPATLVYDLALATDGSGRLFAGTETSAWVKDGDEPWQDITGVDAPLTIYWSVEALQSEPTMRFGTYGRGIWDYQYVERAAPPDGGAEGDDTGDDGPDTPSEEPGGCGCAAGGGAGILALLPVVWGLRRRRR